MATRVLTGLLVALATSFMVLPDEATAQRYGRYDDRRSEQRANVPGNFDYYTLVLSWSPTHCAAQPSKKKDPQCSPKVGKRPYAFILHGLWPQYTRGYPERCWTRFKPYVPRRVINGMLDIMPSTGLIIHEYKKHGTCSGLKPEGYFSLSRRIFNRIKIPQRYVLPQKPQMVSPDTLISEFIAANPVLGLQPDMLVVSCGGAGNRLREVRLCMSKDGDPRPCGNHESQRRLCNARRMYVPPVRLSAQKPATVRR